MDADKELEKGKWILISGALFLLSCFLVYDEFSYLVWGREVQATITKVYESTGRRGGSRLNVDFTFSEPDGTFRRGATIVSPDWPLPRTGMVAVQYTPGELGRARLAGQVSWVAIVFFGGSLLAVGVFGYMMYREAHEDSPKKLKRRV